MVNKTMTGKTKKSVARSKRNDTIEWTIRDNGRGFDVEGETFMGSKLELGLDSVRERVEIAGGSCSIESILGKGTVISVSFPVKTPPH